jgi:hypothetical protein
MTQQTNPCGCGSLPRTLITGRDAERPSPESSPLVAVSGGRAEAQRSRPERPALSKSAGGPARKTVDPRGRARRLVLPRRAVRILSLWPTTLCIVSGSPMLILAQDLRNLERRYHGVHVSSVSDLTNSDGRSRAKRFSSRSPQRPLPTHSDFISCAGDIGSALMGSGKGTRLRREDAKGSA